MSRLSGVARALHRLFDFEVVIAMLALTAMMLVVVADVFMRFVFNAPIRGSYDLVGILLVVMVSFGIPKVIAMHGEIVIDLIDIVVPRAVANMLAMIAGFLGAIVLGFIIWSMIGPAMSAYAYGDRSLELGLPLWIIWVLALIGLAGAMVASLWAMLTPRAATTDHVPVHGETEGIE